MHRVKTFLLRCIKTVPTLTYALVAGTIKTFSISQLDPREYAI